MSRRKEDLDPLFREKVEETIEITLDAGFVPVIFFTLRTPFTQAKLYRATRGTAQIQAKASKLLKAGAPFLAHVLESVGPQYPPPGTRGNLTNALPGYSWHNWGLACDCFIKDANGKAIWKAKHPGYKVYAEAAKSIGLTSGYYWKDPVDSPHIQMPNYGVRKEYSTAEIDSRMEKLFG